MQMFQSQKQLGSIKSTPTNIEFTFPLKMIEQFPTIHETHYQIKFIGGLEAEFEWDDERIIDEREYGPLCQDMGNLTRSRDDMMFPDRLEGVNPTCIFLLDLHHFSKAPFTDDF